MASVPEKPVGVSTYDWETGATTYNVPAMDAGQRWNCALSQATEQARRRFPHSNDRIERAYELVHASKVVLHPASGTATVQSSDGTKAYTVNGMCSCPDATRAPEGYCKHRLAVVILKKAVGLVAEWKQATAPVTVPAERLEPAALEALPVLEPVTTRVQRPACPEFQAAGEDVEQVEAKSQAVGAKVAQMTAAIQAAVQPSQADVKAVAAAGETSPVLEAEVVPYVAPKPTVPAQFVSSIKGKPFVQFAGLLTVATQQGLLSLTERVTHVTDTYVMAEARAEFEDGRVFVGVGDSSPDNVGKDVKPHWRRLAGTRAMARCLRNALNINMVAVEELD